MTDTKRYVVQAKLIGLDTAANKRGRETEYAIEVVLSDESQYTMYRSPKDILHFHNKLRNKFKVEAGYFKKDENVIPECPIKQGVFGVTRAISDDKSFERLLHFYLKELPALPAALIKSELVADFFSLKASDLGSGKSSKKKKNKKIEVTDDSLISGPISLKSYLAIADYEDKKSKFSFKKGSIVQVMQKEDKGWWRVDAGGSIGWAPASYLAPANKSDYEEEKEENDQLIEQEKVGTRYISISAYQASRDDELSFVKGAVVRLVKKYVDGWWAVKYNGGEGFVPGAMFHKFNSSRQKTVYVKKIKRNITHRGTKRIIPTVKPQWMDNRRTTRRVPHQGADSRTISVANEMNRAPEPEPTIPAEQEGDEQPTMYTCVERFEENGIHVEENDEIAVLDDSDDAWWFVEDKRGAKGWAPCNYFKPRMDQVADGGAEDDGAKSGFEQANPGQYEYLEPLSDGEDEEMDDMDNESEDDEEENSYIAIKEYIKADIDELNLHEDQVVCVIDDSDNDIWYVNADGKEGWVPSSHLRPMTDEDREMLTTSGESTPADNRSGGEAADNSELSDDDGLNRSGFKRRSHIRYSGSELFSTPSSRPRSIVLSGTHSPVASRRSNSKDPFSPSGGSEKSDSERNNFQNVTILVDDLSIEELEKEVAMAEETMKQAKAKAAMLKEKLLQAKLQKTA